MFRYANEESLKADKVWGARAIFTRGFVDIVWNRTFLSEDAKADSAFCDKLDKEILPNLQKWADKENINGRVEREFTFFDDENVKVLANTNGSCGYLYLVAFEKEVA